MSLLDLIPTWAKLALAAAVAAAVVGLVGWQVHHQRDIGRAEVQLKWDAADSRLKDRAIAESAANAAETARRLKAQKENQHEQDKLLAAARSDAARNAADADRLRDQNATTARQWSDALSNSPTVQQCASAGTAITVQADMLGRLDRAASEFAAYADTARAAGLKCSADYESLTAGPQAAPLK